MASYNTVDEVKELQKAEKWSAVYSYMRESLGAKENDDRTSAELMWDSYYEENAQKSTINIELEVSTGIDDDEYNHDGRPYLIAINKHKFLIKLAEMFDMRQLRDGIECPERG